MKVHILIRLADSCRIETFILSENDKNWKRQWDELISNGWKHSNTRTFNNEELYIMDGRKEVQILIKEFCELKNAKLIATDKYYHFVDENKKYYILSKEELMNILGR